MQLTPTPPLVVMSFNLRFANDDSPNSWKDRRPVMKNCIQKISPDLIGTQEGLYFQIQHIVKDLQDYEWIGLGRKGGSQCEFMAVFYRKERLKPLEYNHFWLSDTPDVIGSATWGNDVEEWSRGYAFEIENQQSNPNRNFISLTPILITNFQQLVKKSAQLIRTRIEGLNTLLPVILGGDFNANPDSTTESTYSNFN